MRAITKRGTGGFHLDQAHSNPPQTPDQATSRWHSFGHKAAVRQALIDEQYHLCCYSEIRPDQEGLGYHIEHIENKSQNPARTFDYHNFGASALDSDNDLPAFKAQGEVVFGGHASGKRQQCDVGRFVSCHQPDCRRFFAYLSDGRVVPAQTLDQAEADRAQYTIDLLNLNSPFLVTRRRQWWAELDTWFEDHIDNNWSLIELAAVNLVPYGTRLDRFFSLTRQFFGPLAEQTIAQRAPRLL